MKASGSGSPAVLCRCWMMYVIYIASDGYGKQSAMRQLLLVVVIVRSDVVWYGIR
jgi:hypothetical protein